jgi:hypothetical protein
VVGRRRGRTPNGIPEVKLPKSRSQANGRRREGFEHLAGKTLDELRELLRNADGRVWVLSGRISAPPGITIRQAQALLSLSETDQAEARAEAIDERNALRDELRRRLGFRP